MLFAAFTSVFLLMTSWSDVASIPTKTPVRGTQGACTIKSRQCERVAVAFVTGNHGVSGYFKFISSPNNDGVQVVLSVSGLGKYPGPPGQLFPYHVHVNAVGEGHNCSSTLGHLNPFNLPENKVCNPKNLDTCEYGDLAAKHGKLSASGTATVRRSYLDTQLRFTPPQFSMEGRSVVIHDEKLNRIACGNVIFQQPKKT